MSKLILLKEIAFSSSFFHLSSDTVRVLFGSCSVKWVFYRRFTEHDPNNIRINSGKQINFRSPKLLIGQTNQHAFAFFFAPLRQTKQNLHFAWKRSQKNPETPLVRVRFRAFYKRMRFLVTEKFLQGDFLYFAYLFQIVHFYIFFRSNERVSVRLAAVGDFGALHCQPSTNVDRSTALDLTTSAPIAANAC